MDSSQLTLLVSVIFWLLPSPALFIRKWLEQRDPITYEHYKLRAETKKVVHAARSPKECNDGECDKVG